MKTITYTFCDDTVTECEVDDDLYAVILETEQYERRLCWRDAKHRFLVDGVESFLEKNDIDIEDSGSDPMQILIRHYAVAELRDAILQLPQKQRWLINRVFFDGVRPLDIALAENISKQAVNNRLNKIYQKLRNILLKGG